jgi:hypothetical protein
VTILTTLGDDQQKFLRTQLKGELVFKGGRDVIGRNQGPCNKSSLIKASCILPILLGYLD